MHFTKKGANNNYITYITYIVKKNIVEIYIFIIITNVDNNN